jgi:hypothetical protein
MPLRSIYVNKSDPFHSFLSSNDSIVNSLLRSGPNARDPMKSNSRFAMKTIVPLRPSFYCTHYFPDKPALYSDSDPTPLLSQDIFTFIFCAPINNCIKITRIAIASKHRLVSLLSSLPQADMGTGTGISPALSSFLCFARGPP